MLLNSCLLRNTQPKYFTARFCEKTEQLIGCPDLLLLTEIATAVSAHPEKEIQQNFSFGTPSFRGHKIYSRKNVHIIFVFVTSIEGTPLFRGKGPKRGDTLALKT